MINAVSRSAGQRCLHRYAGPVFDPIEAFFLNGKLQGTIFQKCRGRIAVISINSENSHFSIPCAIFTGIALATFAAKQDSPPQNTVSGLGPAPHNQLYTSDSSDATVSQLNLRSTSLRPFAPISCRS